MFVINKINWSIDHFRNDVCKNRPFDISDELKNFQLKSWIQYDLYSNREKLKSDRSKNKKDKKRASKLEKIWEKSLRCNF